MLTLEIDDEIELGWTAETVALRIVQEALQNVRRHAAAAAVVVSVGLAGDAVELVVADDGIGFDPTTIGESGIAVMRSFAALAEGSIVIDSAPGRGTRVVARLGEHHTSAPPPFGDLALISGGSS